MKGWRAVLTAAGLALFLAAPLMAFVTLSVPAMREHPRLGLLAAAVVFLTCVGGFAVILTRRK